MQSAFYVSLSGQVSVDKRIETISNNIANANSAGWRAAGVKFESHLSKTESSAVMSKTGVADVAYATSGKDFISRAPGELTKTDNPYDVAVMGDAWLAIRTPNGVAYTRDGRMQMSPTGELQTVLGYPVLDAGNSAVLLDPSGGPPMISRDGMISQQSSSGALLQLGALGLFTIGDKVALTRADNNSVVPAEPATPLVDFIRNGVVQGHIEGSNVNPIEEMNKLILTSRAFENVAAMQDMMDGTQREAIRTLGGAS